MTKGPVSQAPSRTKTLIIGVDLDNTLVTYDKLLHNLALEQGLIGLRVGKSKKQVRDAIRR